MQFQADLEDYVRALRLPHRGVLPLLEVVGRADFSSARVHLVASKPGYHSGTSGHPAYTLSRRKHVEFDDYVRLLPITSSLTGQR